MTAIAPTFSPPSCLTSCKIRAICVAKGLLRIAEIVSHLALAALAYLAFLASFGFWQGAREFSIEQKTFAEEAQYFCKKYFQGCITPFRPLEIDPALIEPTGELTPFIREHRVRVGADRIQQKLDREWTSAQEQMQKDIDQLFFYYNAPQGHKKAPELQAETVKVEGLEIGIAHSIGRRPTMEDEHLAASFDLFIGGQIYLGKVFGIFDGHAGKEAACFLRDHLREKLIEKLEAFNPVQLTDEGIWNALKMTFVELNEQFTGTGGSTATVAMILDEKLWTANVGDSRTILQNGDQVFQLSEDAKPGYSDYHTRYTQGIINRNGFADADRVNGRVAMARAVGDHNIGSGLSARPKITQISLANILPESHLILGSDGIYDGASTKQVGTAVYQHRQESPEMLATNILNTSYDSQPRDNRSIMVVRLKQP